MGRKGKITIPPILSPLDQQKKQPTSSETDKNKNSGGVNPLPDNFDPALLNFDGDLEINDQEKRETVK